VKIKKYLLFYIYFFTQYMKSILEYRLDFWIGLISTFVLQLSGFSFIWVIFQNITTINGWNFGEVLFIYSLMTIAKSINLIFFDNLWLLGGEYIKSGKFDILLLRPVPPLFHLFATKIQKDGLGSFLVGILLLNKAIHLLNVNLDIKNTLVILLILISGSIIVVSLNLIGSTFAFWIKDSTAIMRAIFLLSEFALYPIIIFNKSIISITTWIIPYSFVSYYPATLFLESHYNFLGYFSPLVAFVLMVFSYMFWRMGLKFYESSGS